MNKNTKKLLILGGVIVAIILLIIADKSFKARQQENKELSQNTAEPVIENPIDSNVEGEDNDETVDSNTKDDKKEKDDVDSKGDSNSDEDSIKDTVEDEEDYSYEEWLAAGVVTAVSMHYMDFDLDSIYLLSENSMADKDESKGVYVAFESDGKDVVIHSAPLAEERSYPGTIDFSTQNFGLASFDEVDVTEDELRKGTEIELDEIVELISKLMLVTVYEH